MIVTVICDASFCPDTKSSGWGVWIKSARGKCVRSGSFTNKPEKSYEAEAMAVSIAVFLAFKYGIARAGDKLLIQSDCLMVIHAYNGIMSEKKISPVLQQTISYTRDLAKERDCKIQLRHVKGHAPQEGNRNYVNEICDKMARKVMKAQRKTTRKKEKANAEV